jgi:superfamily II DNA or RNA helicase
MKDLLVEKLLFQALDAAAFGSYGEAASLCKKVLEYDRNHPLALDYLITYYQDKHDYRKAARYLCLLKERVGARPDLLMTLGTFHLKAGDVRGAVTTFEELREVTSGARGGPERDLRRFAEWQIATLTSRQPRPLGAPSTAPARISEKPLPPTQRPPPGTETVRPPAPDAGASFRQPLEESIPVTVSLSSGDLARLLAAPPSSSLESYLLRLNFHRLTLMRAYDDLVCLPSLNGVERFWYQMETVKKVLRDFGGRVLLADEVGLGKTIEAAMAMKEFLLRGLVRRVLILTPPALVSQWKEELSSKFSLSFTTSDEEDPARRPEFWDADLLLVSINLAKSKTHFEQVVSRSYDLVIVDEAHHLKNRQTMGFKLVSALKSKYLFLLSATPVQNNLIELFNLITLLKPGTLKTESGFRAEYMKRGRPQEPSHPEKLRELLRGVMIRNTRSLVDLKLPRRFATTLVVDPSPAEREIYQQVSALVRGGGGRSDLPESKTLFSTLLREAGSSPFALDETLSAYASPAVEALRRQMIDLKDTEKGLRLIGLLAEKPGEKVIVFSQFRRTLDYLADLLGRHQVPAVVYHGGLSRAGKDQAVAEFRDRAPVLLATESGGEGHNLQFAHTLVNFDLPWNPMRIEQRIGRLHRVGQTRDVFIFNLCSKDTLEHYLLDVLERKINLFELVIGEIDMILGNLDEEREFGDVVFDLWRAARDAEDARDRFEQLGETLVAARDRYRETKRLDDTLFREDFEV